MTVNVPVRDRLRRLRHPGWAWAVRHSRVIDIGHTTGGLCLGLGLSVVVALVTGGLQPGQVRRLLWLLVLGFGLGVVVLLLAEFVRWGRNRMLKRNGTAYIVKERARDWQRDEPDDFYAQVKRHFAQVLEVPGPGHLGPAWDWPLDHDARHWDAKVTDLARSFRALNLAVKKAGTANGIFATAWWAVAFALGQRVTAADRSLELNVWQRPSQGRAGQVQPEVWAQRPHRFGGLAGPAGRAPAGLVPDEHSYTADLVLVPFPAPPAVLPAPPHDGPVSVLLVRFGRQRWGPLPEVTGKPGRPDRLCLRLQDAAGIVPAAAAQVQLHELRYLPPDGAPRFEWSDYPFLAAEAVAWVRRKAAGLAGHTLLLGTIMPNEVALGIGICSGKESGRDGWPGHLWPVLARRSASPFVVPRLDLGTAAMME